MYSDPSIDTNSDYNKSGKCSLKLTFDINMHNETVNKLMIEPVKKLDNKHNDCGENIDSMEIAW